MRYRLTLAYVGTGFAGWQRQINAPTVQQTLEEALERFTGEQLRVVGSGRTDAGVHAEGQLVSLELERELPPLALVHGTNKKLPRSIRILDAAPAPPGFDARRDARAKTYRYRLDRAPVIAPHRAPFVVAVDPSVDVAAMISAARALVGRHDFSAFMLTGAATSTTVRRIFAAHWQEQGGELIFRITGEGFLRGMVRALAGSLRDVGLGRRTVQEFAALLEGGDRGTAGENLPARGLCLERVIAD